MASAASAADISVTITGLRSDHGVMRLALFDNPHEFPRGQEVLLRNVAAHAGEMTVVLEGLPSGTYALALHHDENNNGKMDMSVLGLPEEGYGFSNNALVFLGAPPFSEAAFAVPESGKTIAVHLIY